MYFNILVIFRCVLFSEVDRWTVLWKPTVILPVHKVRKVLSVSYGKDLIQGEVRK